jgi:general secretion pathway protein B
MSYILEALRRAESERERGQVPRLHSQAWSGQGGPEAAGAPAARSGRRWWWLGLGLSLLLGAAAAFWLWQAPAAVTAPPLAPDAQAPAKPLPEVRPPAPVVAPAPASTQVASPDAEMRAASAPWPLPPPPAALPPAARADALRPPPAASAAVVAAASTQPPALAELSPALRAELPSLQVGGAMHSPTPAHRMLILNGQVYREGDQITPGLRLEQIQLRSAVLSYKGQRLRLDY